MVADGTGMEQECASWVVLTLPLWGKEPPPTLASASGGRTTSSRACKALQVTKPCCQQMSSPALTGVTALPIPRGRIEALRVKGLAQDLPAHPPAVPYLGALIEEGVPDLEEDTADETVGKDHEEPV